MRRYGMVSPGRSREKSRVNKGSVVKSEENCPSAKCMEMISKKMMAHSVLMAAVVL